MTCLSDFLLLDPDPETMPIVNVQLGLGLVIGKKVAMSHEKAFSRGLLNGLASACHFETMGC